MNCEKRIRHSVHTCANHKNNVHFTNSTRHLNHFSFQQSVHWMHRCNTRCHKLTDMKIKCHFASSTPASNRQETKYSDTLEQLRHLLTANNASHLPTHVTLTLFIFRKMTPVLIFGSLSHVRPTRNAYDSFQAAPLKQKAFLNVFTSCKISAEIILKWNTRDQFQIVHTEVAKVGKIFISVFKDSYALRKPKPDMQCMYNVITDTRLRTTVAVEKQVLHILGVCVCACMRAWSQLSIMQTAWAVLYCHLPALPHFSTSSHKQHDFRINVIEHKIYVFDLCTNFTWNTSHFKKNFTDILNVHTSSCKVLILDRF
jgi:hypothetical protein